MSDTAADPADAIEPQDDDPGQTVIEQRARNMGWRPRNEFRGDQERWLPAEEFVDRGERMLPLLQERNRAADRIITDLQARVEQQGQTLQEMLESTRRAEQAGYRRAMNELQQQRHRAVETGDMAAFQAVEQAMRELGPPPPEARPQEPQRPSQAPPPPNQDPVILAWVQNNPWFKNDKVANVAMIAAMQQAELEYPSEGTADHLLRAEDVIRRRFPEHFPQRRTNGSGNGAHPPQRRPMHAQDTEEEDDTVQQPRRQIEAAVSRSSQEPGRRRIQPRSFEAMPRDVQQEFERQRRMFEGKGDPLTKEEFATNYWEQEPE
jgi:hypothetical protein